VALCQDRLFAGVVEDELPVREDLIKLIPVAVERRAVPVVLRPDLIRQVSDGVPEFRALAVAVPCGEDVGRWRVPRRPDGLSLTEDP